MFGLGHAGAGNRTLGVPEPDTLDVSCPSVTGDILVWLDLL